MWPFNKKQQRSTIHAEVSYAGDEAVIDVRGQTCPGYLLAINRAVEKLAAGTSARLLISYPPCGDDVAAWAKEREIAYGGISPENGMWVIRIRKD